MKQILIRVRPEIKERLKELAKANSIGVTTLIRMLIMKHLRDNENNLE